MSELSPQVFAILSALVEEKLGLHYGPDDASIFADKVFGRMAVAGFESPLDYYYFLRYDAAAKAETDALAEALVVGETYFFRELDPLRAVIAHVIAPAIAQTGSARIWSAACASGEEPYSLAMLLAMEGLLDKCRIVATDLSGRALQKAREGIYAGRSLRAVDADELTKKASARWLAPEGSSVRVDPRIVSAVELRRVNLLEGAEVAALGTFDLILCRNVLIYFADETIRSVVTTMARTMRPNARLLVGASESLLRFGTLLRCEERSGTFLYRQQSQ